MITRQQYKFDVDFLVRFMKENNLSIMDVSRATDVSRVTWYRILKNGLVKKTPAEKILNIYNLKHEKLYENQRSMN